MAGFVDDTPSPGPSPGKFIDDAPKPGKFVDDAPANTPLPNPNQPQAPTTFHPNSAIRTSAPTGFAAQPTEQHARQQANPLAKAVESGIGTVTGAALGAQTAGMHVLNDSLAAFDAVFGAPERAVEGAIASDGDPVARIRSAVSNATHPFNKVQVGQNTETVMRKLGATKLDRNMQSAVPSNLPFGATQLTKNALHFATVLGVKTLIDPLTLLTAPVKGVSIAAHAAGTLMDVASGVSKVTGVDHAIRPFIKAAQTTGMESLKAGTSIFGRRPELNEHLIGDTGKAARMSIEDKIHNSVGKPVADNDRKLLDSIAEELRTKDKQGNYTRPIPAALQQRTLEEAFVYGNQTMRSQALGHGYEALTRKLKGDKYFESQSKVQPRNALDYNVAKDYQTMIHFKDFSKTEMFDAFVQKGGNSYTRKATKDAAKFEETSKKTQRLNSTDDPVKIWEARLALGRRWTVNRLIDRETTSFLANHGGMKDFDWDNALQVDRQAQAEHTVDKLSYNPKRFELPGIIGETVQKVRDLSRQAVQLNPLPHALRNVGELAYLAGGPRTFGEGIGHAGMGIQNAADIQRMADLGLHADYIKDLTGPLAKTPVAGLFKFDSAVLNRLEGGFRLALLHHYDRVLGPTRTDAKWITQFNPKGLDLTMEYQKAQHVVRDLGDYRNVSAFVAGLQAIGGPFVAFRIGTVPSAVGRSLLKNPNRAEGITRAQQTVNDDPQLADPRSKINVGGPVTDAAELGSDTIGFMTKPATSGMIGQAVTARNRLKDGYGTSPQEFVEQAASNYVPGASLIGGAANMAAQATGHPLPWAPYGPSSSEHPSALREMLEQLFGAYESKRPSSKAAGRREKMLNRTVNE